MPSCLPLALLTVLLAAGVAGCGPRRSPAVTYTLDSAVERNREAPDTFPIPSQAERESLRPGQIVKLMFRIDGPGEETVERMWVIVKERTPAGYLGELDNQPYSTDALPPGAPVRFGPGHVIAIYRERSEAPGTPSERRAG